MVLELTRGELEQALAIAALPDWYRLELHRDQVGHSVRWPLGPSRDVVWMGPLRGQPTHVPQVKISPRLNDACAAWQDMPRLWRPSVLRALLLLERSPYIGVTITRQMVSGSSDLWVASVDLVDASNHATRGGLNDAW